MKKLSLVLFAVFCMLCACGERRDDNHAAEIKSEIETEMTEQEIDFDAECMKTHEEYADENPYPAIHVVRSQQHLNDYYEKHSDLHGYNKYDAKFFEKNALVLLKMGGRSGSIKYEVSGVEVRDSKLVIEVDTIIPEAQTDDLVWQHIFVAIEKKFVPQKIEDIIINRNGEQEEVRDIRPTNYEGEWLDKETADLWKNKDSVDVVITEIYADCFFATYVIPMPHVVKFNGVLSDEWCVGDQVSVTYNKMYNEQENYRREAEFTRVTESDFELDPNVAYKPVIYLYPEQKTEVSVTLNLDGELTCTYPAYDNGWKVTADPNGTLTDANGQIYSYLYWEGETYAKWDMSKGFCVKGEDTAAFLEKALAKLGLTRREANEFIVYWLPLMQGNPYNIISFQTDVYTNAAKLHVAPNPDTLIRVFMTYQSSNSYVDVEGQKLTAPQRTGFTVVEWGGTEVN